MNITVSLKVGESVVAIEGDYFEEDKILEAIEKFKKALKIEYKIG